MAMKLSTSDQLTDDVTRYTTTTTDLCERHLTVAGPATPKVIPNLRREETDMITKIRI